MSFPRYPKYKDSGVEWLGKLPAHWEVKRLKRACQVFPSNVDKKSHEGETPVLLCNYTDVYYNESITAGMALMAATASPEQIARFTLRADDTIITKDSETADDIAVASHVPADLPGVVCGYHLAMVRPRPVTSGAYVKRLFDSGYAKSRFEVLANGLTRVGLGQYELDNVELPFPPLLEQTLIAAFLERETAKIDGLVAEQQRLIELLREKRQAVISHAVTKGLNPNAPMKPSGIEWLGEVPAHWDVTKLSRLATEIGDGLHGTPEYVDESPFHFINGNNLTGGCISLTDMTRCVSEAEFNKHRVGLDQTTVLLSINGTIGNLAVYRDESVMLGKSAAYVNCGNELAREFLCLFLQSSFIRRYFDYAVTGTTISNLSLESIRTIPVALPPLDEQLEITAGLTKRTERLDGLLHEVQHAIDLLQERRTALISAAVTGQIDVRGSVAQPQAKRVPSLSA